MLEMVVLGVTLVLGQVIASLVMVYLTFKLMMSKKFMLKFVKQCMKFLEEITEELTEDFMKNEAE